MYNKTDRSFFSERFAGARRERFFLFCALQLDMTELGVTQKKLHFSVLPVR